MADKKLIQIFAGAVYHQKQERVDVFCRSLHLSNKRNYSNDILNLYLYILGKFQREYNTFPNGGLFCAYSLFKVMPTLTEKIGMYFEG